MMMAVMYVRLHRLEDYGGPSSESISFTKRLISFLDNKNYDFKSKP